MSQNKKPLQLYGSVLSKIGDKIVITYQNGNKQFECIISDNNTSLFREINNGFDCSDNDDVSSISSKSSSKSSKSTTSISTNDFTTIENITFHKDEQEDELLYYDDQTLISETEKILILSRKYKIEDYYKQNKISHRPFTLSGLYSKKNGIKSPKQKYMIRELYRTCENFLETDYAKNNKEREHLILRKKNDDLIKEEIALEEKVEELRREKERERDKINYEIIDYNRICEKVNRRTGIKCTNYCVKGIIYCKDCSLRLPCND
jgi:hypothetical protein